MGSKDRVHDACGVRVASTLLATTCPRYCHQLSAMTSYTHLCSQWKYMQVCWLLGLFAMGYPIHYPLVVILKKPYLWTLQASGSPGLILHYPKLLRSIPMIAAGIFCSCSFVHAVLGRTTCTARHNENAICQTLLVLDVV